MKVEFWIDPYWIYAAFLLSVVASGWWTIRRQGLKKVVLDVSETAGQAALFMLSLSVLWFIFGDRVVQVISSPWDLLLLAAHLFVVAIVLRVAAKFKDTLREIREKSNETHP